MSSIVKISNLPAGTASADSVVPVDNAAGTATEKVTLGQIAAIQTTTGADDIAASAAISSETLTLDLAAARVFYVALDANITTLTFANVPSTANRVVSVSIVFTADGTARSITWPASVLWPSATAPTVTSTNAKQTVLTFSTSDAGTSWLGFVGGLNY